MKHFYDTVPLAPSELLEAQGRAISQEDRIFNWMNEGDGIWTAWALNEVFPKYCLTSIRRALHNLEKQGKVTKIGFVDGPMGKPVGKYIAFTGKLF